MFGPGKIAFYNSSLRFLTGALLLVGADVAAMQILSPVIIPIGVMTAFMGVPLFFYLIMRIRREHF